MDNRKSETLQRLNQEKLKKLTDEEFVALLKKVTGFCFCSCPIFPVFTSHRNINAPLFLFFLSAPCLLG